MSSSSPSPRGPRSTHRIITASGTVEGVTIITAAHRPRPDQTRRGRGSGWVRGKWARETITIGGWMTVLAAEARSNTRATCRWSGAGGRGATRWWTITTIPSSILTTSLSTSALGGIITDIMGEEEEAEGGVGDRVSFLRQAAIGAHFHRRRTF